MDTINHYEYHHREEHEDSALNVTAGVESQPVVNPYFKRVKRRVLSTDDYVNGILEGNISILSQAITLVESNNRAQPKIVANVPPNCFIPRPNVGSAVIRLTRYEVPPVQVEDEKKMFSIIRASFNQRRKTLVNGLGNAGICGITKERVAEVLEQMQLSPTIRGEALTLEQFAKLSNLL